MRTEWSLSKVEVGEDPGTENVRGAISRRLRQERQRKRASVAHSGNCSEVVTARWRMSVGGPMRRNGAGKRRRSPVLKGATFRGMNESRRGRR